ncbi:MAG TPA: hypothetical protein VGE97_07530 [Nitrososphaera sp.]|jgi:hypothetical protein
MDNRFGEELTLDEILTDQEKAEDKFLHSRSGDNFGPELTLAEVLEILHQTALPPRAGFFDKYKLKVQEAIQDHSEVLEIEDYKFKLKYYVDIVPDQKFQFGQPSAYRIPFSPNGKVLDDSESVD